MTWQGQSPDLKATARSWPSAVPGNGISCSPAPHDSLGWGIEKSELYTWVRSLTEQTHGITFLISQTSWTNMFVWFWSCCPVCREKQPEFCVVWVAFHSLGLRRGWRGKDCALIWIFSADFANIAVASVRETAMYLMQHYETLCNTMQHYATLCNTVLLLFLTIPTASKMWRATLKGAIVPSVTTFSRIFMATCRGAESGCI